MAQQAAIKEAKQFDSQSIIIRPKKFGRIFYESIAFSAIKQYDYQNTTIPDLQIIYGDT
jgi:hypothetical protein